MNSTLLETAKKLPLAERVELAEVLWETIAAEGYEPERELQSTGTSDRPTRLEFSMAPDAPAVHQPWRLPIMHEHIPLEPRSRRSRA